MSSAKTFVTQLYMLLKTAQIHDPGNQAFKAPLDALQKTIGDLMAAEDALRLESVETNLYLNEEKIRTDISTFGTFQHLRAEFEKKNVGGIRFTDTPSTAELIEFTRVMGRSASQAPAGAAELNAALAKQNVHSIELMERIDKKSVSAAEVARSATQKQRALKHYVKAMDVMKESAAGPAETRKAKRIVYNLVDICMDEGFSFMGLSNIKSYDEYTFNHSVNVCVIAIGFGKNLGLTKKQIGELGIAALFHDYGKLAIPRNILNKPGRFEPGEWEVMKSHPLQSVKTLLSIKDLQETDIKKMIAAFEHHRNYDCSGYPVTGLNKPMNFYSKVVAIADAYDAMTTNRVYQRALLPTAALKILLDNAGTKFDPLLVKAFINTVGIYPVGTVLKMTSGKIAVVTSTNSDPTKIALPKVRIAVDEKGNQVENDSEIDLGEEGAPAIEMVVRPEDYQINVAHYLFKEAAQ